MQRISAADRLPSLADVLTQLGGDGAAVRTHANIFSAIRTVGRVLDLPLADIPAHVEVLRALLMEAKPGAHGIGPTRWANVRSSLNQALRTTGILRDNYAEPCSAAWEAVASQAGTMAECSAIRRLGRFCTMQDIAPAELNDAAIAAYGAHLGERQLSKSPERIVKDAIRLWNRLAKGSPDRALPELCIEASDRNYTLRWEALPKALAADARRFYENAVTPDWFDLDASARTVRKTTADQRDRMLRRLASAEILAGVSAADLHALADVVRTDYLRPGLDFMIKRAGGQPSKQVFEMTHLALTIARHWAKKSDEEIAQLDRWARRFRPVKRGMTDKNRVRLQQFGDGQTIARLVNLPEKTFAALGSLSATPMNARKAQRALILAILTVAPIRLANLRALDRHQHFQRAFSLQSNQWQLVLRASEVKNHQDLAFPVPAHVMAMIDLYLERYQPLLGGTKSSLLFPGREGSGPMSDSGLRLALISFVQRELGLTINPHLFRHLSALIFLRTNPGQYESVRQLLGHKNIQTTIEHYASFDNDEAMQRYTDIVTTFRDTVPGQKG